jgi:dipeptidyl aminopeptidase/acylaminoacyl peptidase
VGSHLALSTDGRLIYREGPWGVASRMVWVDRAGRATPADTSPLSQVTSLSVMPDGRRVAFSVVANKRQDIWIRTAGGAETRVTSDDGAHFRPVWSPDGKTVFYVQGDTTFRLMEQSTEGRGAPRPVPVGNRQVVESTISADGRYLVLRTGGSAGRREILLFRRGQDTVARVISSSASNRMGVSLSPDARFVAYAGFETPDGEIYVSPFPDMDSGRWQVSTRGGVSPQWSLDGKELFYVNSDNDLVAAKVASAGGAFSVTSQERLFSMTPFVVDAGFRMYQPLLGSQRFAMLRTEPYPGRLVVVENWFSEIREKLRDTK